MKTIQKIKKEVRKRDRAIGRKIRRHRKNSKLTQGQLARKLGVSQQQMMKYEKGRNKISASRVELLAEIMSLPITCFLESI